MNEWIESLSGWLLRTSVEGSILIAAVLGLSWMLGRHLGPRWRVILWTLVGLKLLIPAFVPATPGLGNWLRAESEEVDSTPAVPVIPETDAFEEQAEIPVWVETESISPAAAPVADARWNLSLSQLLFFLWMAGTGGMAVALFVRQRRFLARATQSLCRDRRLLALVREVAGDLGVRRDIRVLLSAEGSTPAVFGAWRSCLLLPADWEQRFDTGSFRHILMHEIEHIRYRDVLWNWVAAAVNAIHWFNPLVWLAVSRFQSDRELRCDAGTVSRLQPAERLAYGQTLLRVQKEFIAAPATAGVAPCVRNHPTLHQRILMITTPTDKKNWLNAVLALGVAGLISFSFGSANADQERSSRESSRVGERSAEREGSRDGERGSAEREGSRDGERGSAEREGARDGERGSAEREGSRDGERGSAEREGSRDGERGSAEREGARDGERGSAEREGARDGDRPREGSREGARDGDRPREGSREGARDGERSSREGGVSAATLKELNQLAKIYRTYDKDSNDEVTFKEWVAMKNYELSRDQEKREKGWFDDADADNDDILTVEEFQQWKLGQKYPAMREGGGSREGSRDGDRPRESSRDGDRPREGTRDGDKPREGARDGDKPREGSRDGDRPSREGARDGDRPSAEGSRDGDRPREGARDGDKPREGARDGDQPRREGSRDGDQPRREGARDGDRPSAEGSRDGDQPRREGARDGDR